MHTDTDIAANGLVDKDGNVIGKPHDIERPIGHAAAVEAALLSKSTIVRTMKDRIKLAGQAAALANKRESAAVEAFFKDEPA